jgi:putative endonuclease
VNLQYSTFILASKRHGALYVDMTRDLANCVFDHKCNLVDGITSQYAIHQLVYYEHHADEESARLHANWINQLHRIWKMDLIEQHNPAWRDLYDSVSEAAARPMEIGLSMVD